MGGSEGHSVVATDVGRQAALSKKPLKYSESVVFSGEERASQVSRKTARVVVTVSG
jgi:hypothetical protein